MDKKSQFFSVFAVVVSLIAIPNFSRADTLGQKESFLINSDFDKYNRNQLSATLRYNSNKLYFYVEDRYWDKLDTFNRDKVMLNLSILTNEFDNNIYPKETSFWGSEPNPGVDGDPKLTILVEELISGNGGYFNTANGYTKDQISDSNGREMIFLSAEAVNSESGFTKVFLAHEFQHLISFNQKELINKSTEDVWLNELRSEYSISLTGYNDTYYDSSLNRRAVSFLENPSDSLTEWPNESTDYSIVSVFAEYLAEQYGNSILSETLKMPLSGINSFNNFLQTKVYYERFSDIFLKWMTAVYLNNVGLDNQYGYTRPELQNIKVKPQQSIFMSGSLSEFTSSHSIKNWQPIWLEYNFDSLYTTSDKGVRIDVSGQSDQNFLVSYIVFFNDGRIRVNYLPTAVGKGTGYISNLGSEIKKVVVLATDGTKLSQFYTKETPYNLSVKVSLVDAKVVETALLKDGALIRKPNEKEIYVIWGKYKRYLVPGVIALYGHLDSANAIEVSPEVFNSYTTSNYVKYANDEKVYAVWPDITKHWLNITPRQWDASSRDWGAIFTINDLELNYYKIGADITR